MSSWNVSIDNKTATSMGVSWKNLSRLLSQNILHYLTVIKSGNGSIVSGNILQGNTTSDVLYGLSPYMEYRLNVLGVNDNGNVYKTSEVTEWTEESGMFLFHWLPCLPNPDLELIHNSFSCCISL